MRKPRRIRDLTAGTKEFPQYRQTIESLGWFPQILCDATDAYWDGRTIRDKDGQIHTGISDPAQKQLIKMMLSGYFGDEVKDAFMDSARYERIQDDLITWPKQEVIAEESLLVLDLKSKR